MADATAPMMDASGIPLKLSLRRAESKKRRTAIMLVLPLLAFILITFIFPIGQMLWRSVDNPKFQAYLPKTTAILQKWDGKSEIGNRFYETMGAEMAQAMRDRTLGKVANRFNRDMSGGKSLIIKTGRKLKKLKTGPYKDIIINADKRWSDPNVLLKLKISSTPFTSSFYAKALDYGYDNNGELKRLPDEERIYIKLFIRTFVVALAITVITIFLAYPISYLMAHLPARHSNLLMILVLLPFWTSLLVRTTSWIVLLQTEGTLNDIMVWLGIIGDENRVQMIYNMTGTIVAMSHILLPFMVLPLYSVMKTISPNYTRAARSLGANPFVSFYRIYFPQSVPGIGAGSILVFILAVGYYITPALVGGQNGTLISNMIAFHMQKSLNWGLAAALGGVLLACIILAYWVYDRIVGIDNMKLG